MMHSGSGVDPNLLAELRPGERLLWWGRPNPKRRVSPRRSRLSAWQIGWNGALLLLFVAFNGFVLLHLRDFDGSLLLVALLVDVGLLLNPVLLGYSLLLEYRHVRALRSTIYAITNERALIMTTESNVQRGVVSYLKSDIGSISRHEGKDGWGSVIFGLPRPSMIRGRQVMASASFGGIPQVRMVEEILFRTFKQDEQAAKLPLAGEQVRQE
jgi:hypothetical protein